jgi:hypothetical protein
LQQRPSAGAELEAASNAINTSMFTRHTPVLNAVQRAHGLSK